MLDTVQNVIYGIGALALMPAAFAIIGSLRAARKARRRAAMFDRFNDRIGL